MSAGTTIVCVVAILCVSLIILYGMSKRKK